MTRHRWVAPLGQAPISRQLAPISSTKHFRHSPIMDVDDSSGEEECDSRIRRPVIRSNNLRSQGHTQEDRTNRSTTTFWRVEPVPPPTLVIRDLDSIALVSRRQTRWVHLYREWRRRRIRIRHGTYPFRPNGCPTYQRNQASGTPRYLSLHEDLRPPYVVSFLPYSLDESRSRSAEDFCLRKKLQNLQLKL